MAPDPKLRSADLPSQKQVIELLDGEFTRAGYEIDDVVIDAAARPPRVTVVADGDQGLDLDSLAELSRTASELLDQLDRGDTPYVLEVTSRGVDRPLTEAKHFRRNRARKAELTLADGSTLTGRLGRPTPSRYRWWSGPPGISRSAGSPSPTLSKPLSKWSFRRPTGVNWNWPENLGRGPPMNIDMAALHAIEADKGITVDVVIETIKSALLTAYRHTDGHEPDAYIDIDRKTGVVKVIARQTDADGNVVHEWDDTPEGFGRIAATTARQVILQRLRDAENEKTYGEFSAHEGDIVAGVIQRDARANARGLVVVRIGSETRARKV